MRVDFTSCLRVQDLAPESQWCLLESLDAIVTNDDGSTVSLSAPAAFVTDFCSVPRLPVVYAVVGNLGFKAGALHDHLYSEAKYPRLWCDQVLRAALIACGLDEGRANAMYEAVRLFGASHYNSYGWTPDTPDRRDQVIEVAAPAGLPSAVDLRPLCPNVYDQGNLGSCTANAIAAAIHFDRMKQGLTPSFIPSRLFIYYNERAMEGSVDSDAGAQIRDGIKAVATFGDCPEAAIPGFLGWNYRISDFAIKPSPVCYAQGIKYKAVNYARVPQNRDAMRQVLASGYPFVFGFSVYESFESAEVAASGVVPMPGPSEKMLGGHAVMAVGYDDASARLIVRNSWGKGWGQAGYFTIPMDYLEDVNLAADFWRINLVSA